MHNYQNGKAKHIVCDLVLRLWQVNDEDDEGEDEMDSSGDGGSPGEGPGLQACMLSCQCFVFPLTGSDCFLVHLDAGCLSTPPPCPGKELCLQLSMSFGKRVEPVCRTGAARPPQYWQSGPSFGVWFLACMYIVFLYDIYIFDSANQVNMLRQRA